MTNDEKLATLLNKVAAHLGQHFDSVRIVTTHKGDDGLHIMSSLGAGNYYAQRGSVEEWLQDCKNYDHAQAHADAFKATPPDNEGDEWKGGYE